MSFEKSVESALQEIGLWLLDISIRKTPTRKLLVVTIDHVDFAKPVGLEDCVRASHALEASVDAFLGEQPYDLQVTSPGERRPLRTAEQRQLAIGSRVSLVFPDNRNLNGKTQRRITGLLTEVNESSLVVKEIFEEPKKGSKNKNKKKKEVKEPEVFEIQLDGTEKIFQLREFKLV